MSPKEKAGGHEGGDVVLAEHGLQRGDVAEVAGAHPERLQGFPIGVGDRGADSLIRLGFIRPGFARLGLV